MNRIFIAICLFVFLAPSPMFAQLAPRADEEPSPLAAFSGGGYSAFEARPSFQSSIASLTGAHRAVPDVAAVGNPRTGVWVYNSYDNTYSGALYAWNIIGGTSVASPLWAGIVNHAGSFSASTSAEETLIYGNATNASDFRDITSGTCGYYEGWSAVSGWDPCSGNGAPQGLAGK